MNSRAIAAKIIAKVISQQQSLTTALASEINRTTQDASFIQELCFGVLRWYPKLLRILQKLLAKPLKKSDADLQALLLIGFYQILYLRTPDHAAVNETVNAAKDLEKPWAIKLINAVLRNFIRQREDLLQQLSRELAAEYAHPVWFIKKLQQAWPEQWQAILAANNEHPPLWLRVNLQKISRAEYLKQLTDNQLAAISSSTTASGVLLTKPLPATEIPGFNEGLVSVQDDAAQLAAYLLELAPEQNILDACAAPGGKTCHILELQPDVANLTAIDCDAQRLTRIQENLTRLKLSAKLIVGDASEPTQWWNGELFDRILLDSPCSATGVIRRHPDIKLLRTEQDVANLATQQHALLAALWPLLKPNGILLYVTCSILPQENQQIIAEFLQHHSDVCVVPLDLPSTLTLPAGAQILTGSEQRDGFYYAKLMKTT